MSKLFTCPTAELSLATVRHLSENAVNAPSRVLAGAKACIPVQLTAHDDLVKRAAVYRPWSAGKRDRISEHFAAQTAIMAAERAGWARERAFFEAPDLKQFTARY